MNNKTQKYITRKIQHKNITQKYNTKIQHGNTTHHTTRIKHKHVYTNTEIKHIIKHAYNKDTFIQHNYTTHKSKIKQEKKTSFC